MLKHLWYDLCGFNPEDLWTRLPLNALDDLSRPMVYRLDSLLPNAKGINKLLPLGLRWLTILPNGHPVEEALAMDAKPLPTGDLGDADGVIDGS